MRSPLYDAVSRCQARRLLGLAAAAPLPATAIAILALLAPFALARIGHAIGGELAGAVGAVGVSEALVVGPVLAAGVGGASLAVSLPGSSALGQQVAAGPCGRRTVVLAGLLAPGAIVAVVLLPSLVAACVAVARELPGGGMAGVALAAATVSAVPAGAIAAEGGVAVARGRARRALGVVIGALAWVVTGTALGSSPLGPLAPVASALRGSESPWLALTVSLGLALALAVIWIGVAAARPEVRARNPRPRRRLTPDGRLAVPAAVAALVARRSDVRLAAAGATAFGITGIVIARVGASASSPGPFLLVTTTALVGSMLCPLAVCGALLDGGWLWRGGPAERRPIVQFAGLVGLIGSALPVAVVGGVAAAVSGTSWNALGVVATLVVVGSAVALLAGTVVPWRRKGVGDQLATFAAFASIAIAASLLVGLVAPRLVSAGFPDLLVAPLVCGSFACVALHALGRRLRVDVR